ncbi:hypothetical protein SADUNF_Sadunf07G0053500 [Salix dunnii]|uniref:Uncharacterized protein n=1 Tax=Salix dunnii TaxID=1413687 RepID=A0A835MYY9_9ROSI|nr:hypothetical protein SADUNF_Sadunf07G0053500 [Salix dunnii]
MPASSSTMTEGKIISWFKSEGDKLSKGESVVFVESNKADMDVETFYDGYLATIMVEEGGVAVVGSAITLLEATEEAKFRVVAYSFSRALKPTVAVEVVIVVAPPSPSMVASTMQPVLEGGKRVVASLYAKKLANELKVELGRVRGSGPNGRIMAKDVEAVAATELGSIAAKVSGAPSIHALPKIELGRWCLLRQCKGQ